MEKDRMFQYAYDDGIYTNYYRASNIKIIENTDLITAEEAKQLWQKYYPEVISNLKEGKRPQMCIWKDCDTTTSYHTGEKEIDYRDDLEIKNGKIYKVKKEVEEII